MKIVIGILAALALCPFLQAPSDAQLAAALQPADKSGGKGAGDDGFVSLFNGKDLSGWHNVNCAPGTFFVRDGMIITTGIPTGYLRTAKQYENFILEFEWFHAPANKGSVGNSGLFVWGDPIPAMGTGYTRSIEVQVLVNLEWKDKKSGLSTATSQGDLFSIWGAKCKPDRPHPLGWERCIPSENRCKGEYEWNNYQVIANNGVLKLAVNGKVVSGVSECNPRKGYLALESEGSECRFKNIKIKELPSTNPKASEICDVDLGWKALFTGVDLTHWKVSDAQKPHWKMSDGVLSYDGKVKGESALWSDKALGDFELVVDWRFSATGERAIYLRGTMKEIALKSDKKNAWHRSIIRVKGDLVTVRTDNAPAQEVRMPKLPKSGPIALVGSGEDAPDGGRVGGAVRFRNVFIRELMNGE